MIYLSNYKVQLNDVTISSTVNKNSIYIDYYSDTYGNVRFNIISIPYVEAYKLMKTVFSSDSIYLYYKKGVTLKYNYLVNVTKYSVCDEPQVLDIEYNILNNGEIVKPTTSRS